MQCLRGIGCLYLICVPCCRQWPPILSLMLLQLITYTWHMFTRSFFLSRLSSLWSLMRSYVKEVEPFVKCFWWLRWLTFTTRSLAIFDVWHILVIGRLPFFVQAYNANVICPNKNQADPEKFHKSHLLESETYIGGHVECLESGVFRSDIPTGFKLDTSAYQASNLLYLTQYDFSCCFLNITSSDMVLFKCHLFMHLSDIGPFNCQQLIDNLDRDLEYAITVEGKMRMDSVSNYDEVKEKIKEKVIDSPSEL